MSMYIRDVQRTDARAIAEIYNHYIENSVATFEEEAVSESVIQERIDKIQVQGLPWIIIESEGKLLGYAYAGVWNARSAYRYSVESSVYVAPQAGKKGIGKSLYLELISRLKQQGIKNVLGVITLPNPASIGLHEHCGFRKVGEFEQVGFKFGRWISVGYWQLQIDQSG